MGFRCGIVGLPNVGKSTLFNALTETAAAQAANYPFCTIEPNVGRVAVPDARLDSICGDRQAAQDDRDPDRVRRHRRPGPRRVQGRRPRQPVPRQHPRGRRHRPCAALLRRRRRHPRRGPRRPDRRRRDRRDRADARRPRQPRAARSQPRQEGAAGRQGSEDRGVGARPGARPAARVKAGAADEAQGCRGREGAAARSAADRQAGPLRLQRRRRRSGRTAMRISSACSRRPQPKARMAVVISAAIEAEIATLPAEEREAFLADLGLDETGLDPHHPRRLRAARPDHLLHRRPQGSRAPGPSHRGAKAPEAAGEIHTDFERGFIRAETIAYDDFVDLAAKPGRRKPARCARKARNMSSRTATSCSSASTSSAA